MSTSFCALGCLPTRRLFIFPSRKHDLKRRQLWLSFFDMEEPNIPNVFACENHFSHLQTTSTGLRNGAVPDIPTISDVVVHPFKRRPKNWRTNVIVVTPRDPEFAIYRRETGVFPQDLFNNIDSCKPAIQMPVIKSVACSMSSQTNTRLCGLVQISDVKEEYRLNCFYCSEIFPIERWSMFVNHLKSKHFEMEEAFRMSEYLSKDHDYTAIRPTNAEFSIKSPTKINMISNKLTNLTQPPPAVQSPEVLPALLAKPFQFIKIPTTDTNFKKPEITPPPLLPKPKPTNNKLFNISLADKVIKLLNETLLSPKFVQSDDDNILIIRNSGSDSIETSTFLKSLANLGGDFSTKRKPAPNLSSQVPSSSSKHTRPVYTINKGLQDIPSGRNSLSNLLFPPPPKTTQIKLVQKRIAQQTLKSINFFETVYKTVKKRSNVVEIAYPVDSNAKKSQEMPKLTPLSRCLRRTISDFSQISKPAPKVSTQIVFEYTPRDIVISLIENMKNYPVLWEFHDLPFNNEYSKAIGELCRIVNNKWSLNITLLKMKRSLNRILRFYRFMLPRESIDEFEDYFDKCALFLPSSVDAIPRARCVYCCICFERDADLRKHIIVKHKSLKWPYKCAECFERFIERDEYELHRRLPHYTEIFKCAHCDKRFDRRHLYNKHVAAIEKAKERRIEASQPKLQHDEFKCDICEKTFATSIYLNCHKKRHTQTFKCHLCPKEFKMKSSLRLHLKRHNNELDYICEVCGKGFILKSYLNEHMKKHNGAKVTCNICNLKLRKCNLLRHLRLVHIVSEGTIGSTFRAKSYRYQKFIKPRTRRRTESPRHYNCKVCKITFERLKELKDHNKQMHSDVKKTPCKICAVEFIHLQNLKRHYRDKHKLHIYQVYMLVYRKDDVNKVLAMTKEELDRLAATEVTTFALMTQNIEKENFSEQERSHSDEIQDEIMKAVENLDKQEIRVDDDHSMHDFFSDLLK